MRDDVRGKSRRAIVLFIGCVTLAFAMFAAGLLIGRWMGPPERRIEPVSLTPPKSDRGGLPARASAPPAATSETSSGEPTAYVIWAGSFSSSEEAERFVLHLKERGFDMAFTRPASAPTGEPLVEVVLGPFADAEKASHWVRELRNNGVSDLRIIPER